MKKTKTPSDEMFLAKIIQNAGAKNLWSCRGALFKDAEHNDCAKAYARFCCAVGAAALSSDTFEKSYTDAIVEGNDGRPTKSFFLSYSRKTGCPTFSWEDSFEIGQAFFHARQLPRK